MIDPEAAEVVKRIFALYLAGNGTTRIARILNEECVPSPTQYKREHGVVWKRPARYKNEDLWGKATIYRMLTNRSYAGDMEQGRHKKVSYKSKKTVWIPKKIGSLCQARTKGSSNGIVLSVCSRCCARMPGAEAGAR